METSAQCLANPHGSAVSAVLKVVGKKQAHDQQSLAPSATGPAVSSPFVRLWPWMQDYGAGREKQSS
jgi:hypothetical protein